MHSSSERPTVYNFDKTEKFFLYQEVARLDPLEQKPMLPGNATFIAPPETWEPGTIPVFNGVDWDIVQNTFWMPTTIEVNFDAGRSLASWAPSTISISDFPSYPSLDRLTNSFLVVMRLVDAIRYIDTKFVQLLDLYDRIKGGETSTFDYSGDTKGLKIAPTVFGTYKFESEALVFQMRHCLDTLCRLTELLVDGERVNEKKLFRYDGVGSILPKKGKNSLVASIVLGLAKDYESDATDFLRTSNNLFNAMKHTHMNAETQILFGKDWPTIVAYSAPEGTRMDKIYYHNHNAYHLMMGFHDAVGRILRNQAQFLKLQT